MLPAGELPKKEKRKRKNGGNGTDDHGLLASAEPSHEEESLAERDALETPQVLLAATLNWS